MPNNILRGILNIASFKNNDLKGYASTYLNRINAVGEQLEFYIKDAIASSFKLPHEKSKKHILKFLLGLATKPPSDIIIKNGTL